MGVLNFYVQNEREHIPRDGGNIFLFSKEFFSFFIDDQDLDERVISDGT